MERHATRHLARLTLCALVPVVCLYLLLTRPSPTQAAGTVGNGTPQSCTEAQLDIALQGGGLVTFNCGPAALTLIIHQTEIVSDTTLDGGGRVSLSGNNLNALFVITAGVVVTFDNVRLTNGYNDQFLSAAALMNTGTLIIRRSEIVNGTCVTLCLAGAIVNGGTLRIEDSVIHANFAGVGAGAIANFSNQVLITRTTIADNHVIAGTGAGAFFNRGTLLLRDSTLVSNTTTGDGGAIANINSGTVVLVNATLSANRANLSGGALSNEGTIQLYNATVTNNQADADFNGTGTGGGITNTGTFEFRNTILAANSDTIYNSTIMAWLPHTNDCNGRPTGTFTSLGNNILVNYNLVNCPLSGNFTLTDPKLGTLGDNGGPTWTHILLSGSPAINAGNPSGCVDNSAEVLARDQRGWARPYPAGGACDIGAVEMGARLLLPIIAR